MSYEDNVDRAFCYSPSKVTTYEDCVVAAWFIVDFSVRCDWELISAFGTPEASKFLNLPTRTVIMNFRVGVCLSQVESCTELRIKEYYYYFTVILSLLIYFYELFILELRFTGRIIELGDAWFESRLWHRLSWQYFHGLCSLSKQIRGSSFSFYWASVANAPNILQPYWLIVLPLDVQISPLVSFYEVLAARGGNVYEPSYFRMFQLHGQEMAGEFCLKMPDFHVTFRDLLCAVNLRHGTDGFTSPPKEGVLRIFFALKNPTASVGFEPANLGTKGQHATSRPLKPLNSGLVQGVHYKTQPSTLNHLFFIFSKTPTVSLKYVI